MIKKINWLGRSATKNRMLMELSDPNLYQELDGYFVFDHICKLTNREIANLNYMRKENNLSPISKEEAIMYFKSHYEKFSNPSADVLKILGRIDSNGEIN